MKRCPTCNKTYSDDSMSFCLEDGAPLLTVGGGDVPTPPNFDPNLTIPYTPPRDTAGQPPSSPGSQWPGAAGPPSSPPSGFGQPAGPPSSGGSGFGQGGSGYGQGGSQYGQSGGQYGGPPSGQFPPPQQPPPQSNQYQPAPSWSPQPTPSYAPTAAKKSSALPWVLGGIGLLLVLGVVGAVIIGVLASMGSDNTNKNNSNNSNSTANKSNRNANSSNANNSNSNSNTTASTPSLRDDFSTEKWWTGTVSVGSAWYANDEYHLKGNEGGYMVVYGPKTNDYHTENARTSVTARSITGNSPSLGFGLSVYGEMKNNILEDYSFLIRTGAGGDPAYRIVLHQAGKENVLVPWTSSSVIRTGTSPNKLEVRSEGKKLLFYINDQYITSVNDDANYGAGLAGLYTSDTDEVAFDDLEIYK